jgi:hypothetical protein
MKTSSSRSAGPDLSVVFGSSATPPNPQFMRGFAVVIILVVIAVIGVLRRYQEPWQAWALRAQTAVIPLDATQSAPDLPQRIAGALLSELYRPDVQGWIDLALAGVLGIVLLEALVRLTVLTQAFWAPLHRQTSYRRVRALHPNNRVGFPRSDRAEQLRALAHALRTQGGGAEIALMLSRTPNMPASLGIQLHGPPQTQAPAVIPALQRVALHLHRSSLSLFQRARTIPAAPQTLQGTIDIFTPAPLVRQSGHRPLNRVTYPTEPAHTPEPRGVAMLARVMQSVLKRFDETTLVDRVDDPLHTALAAGGTLIVRELRLERGPEWPLALADAIESDVMRSLAQAIAVPTGVMMHEVQLCIAPVRTFAWARWYRQARWLATTLKQRFGVLGGDEYKAISTKLNDTHLAVTLRLLAVVPLDGDPRAGAESLEVIASALRTLDATIRRPSGMLLTQRFTHTHGLAGGSYRMPPQPVLPRLPAWCTWLLSAGSMVIGLSIGLAIWTWNAGLWQVWADLPISVQHSAIAIGLLQGTLGVAVTLWAGVALRPWQALYRVGRPGATTDPLLLDLLLPGVRLAQPAILACSEAAHLWHLPDDQARTEIDWLPNRILPAPESAFVPPAATDSLTFGRAYDSGGALRPVGVPLRALHQMLHFTAGMGTGKSQSATAMCRQLIPHGFILLDGKGDDAGGSTASVVRTMIPPEEEHRLRLMDVMDTAFPLALNPIYHLMVDMDAATTKAERDRCFNEALGMVLGLFQRLDPGRWRDSPGMQQYAQMACHLVLRTGSSRPGDIPTLAKVKRVLEDPAYRDTLLERYPMPGDEVDTYWKVREPALSEAQRTSLSALLRRLDMVFMNPITRNMLSVEVPSIDFREALEEGLIVILPMPHRQLGDLAPLVGMLMIQSIVSAAYARPGDAQSRITAPVFIDEVQVFIIDEHSPDLEQAFTQLRGFGVPLIVLHQYLSQLGVLQDTFKVNAGNRIILRTGEPDASVYARMYAQSGLRAEDILGMHALHHQYAAMLGPNREQLIFSMLPNPWPDQPEYRLSPALVPLDWQRRSPPLPDDAPLEEQHALAELDALIGRYVYQPLQYADYTRFVGQLAQLPDDEWAILLERWAELRAFHYRYLLAHPNVIPNQLQRQRWLSRLVGSRSAVIEEAIILRHQTQLGGVVSQAALLKLDDTEGGKGGAAASLLDPDLLPAHRDAPAADGPPRFSAMPDAEGLLRSGTGDRVTGIGSRLRTTDDEEPDQ